MANIQYTNFPVGQIHNEYRHDASLEAEVGDMMWYDAAEGNLKPASQFPDQGSEAATQRAFAAVFAGICLSRQLATDSTARLAKILREAIILYPCASATFAYPSYVAPTYTAGVLSDQNVTKVTDPSRAIAKVVAPYASATTEVKAHFTSKTFSGLALDGNGSASVVAAPGVAAGGAGTALSYAGGAGAPHTTGTGGAGGAGSLSGGVGGTATTGTGGAGGAVSTVAGAGGAASGAAGTGGVGGAAALTAGAGGAASDTAATAAGVGGAASVTSGAGGASSTTAVAGGAGGALSVTGGAGGAGAAAGTGGAGSAVAITGGAGGATSGAGTGGAGGSVTIQGGAGGTTVAGTNGAKGVVNVVGLVNAVGPTAVSITGATVLTLADSGGIFSIDQDAAFDIDLPSPTVGPGLSYLFVLGDAGANNVTITVAGGAATFIGTIHIDGATIVATGATLTFASGTSALGDWIQIRSIATNLYHVSAMSSAAGGITIA